MSKLHEAQLNVFNGYIHHIKHEIETWHKVKKIEYDSLVKLQEKGSGWGRCDLARNSRLMKLHEECVRVHFLANVLEELQHVIDDMEEMKKTACVNCTENEKCTWAYALYNLDVVPGIDCLAAK